MFDAIALCTINDVYERSGDIAAFVEYVHYRLLSIRLLQVQEPNDGKWKRQLDWLTGAIVGECENLMARGRTTALVKQVREVVSFVVQLDQSTGVNPRLLPLSRV
jgi:hypothetical protein